MQRFFFCKPFVNHTKLYEQHIEMEKFLYTNIDAQIIFHVNLIEEFKWIGHNCEWKTQTETKRNKGKKKDWRKTSRLVLFFLELTENKLKQLFAEYNSVIHTWKFLLLHLFPYIYSFCSFPIHFLFFFFFHSFSFLSSNHFGQLCTKGNTYATDL